MIEVLQNEHKINDEVSSSPLFCIGLIADIQYANINDSNINQHQRMRRYRQSLQLTQKAVEFWNDETKCKPRPICIISLGDLIDGQNAPKSIYNPKGINQSQEAMQKILTIFSKFNPPKNIFSIINDEKENKNEENINILYGDEDWIPKYPYFHNVIGNHDLYNFDRKQLLKYLYSPTLKPDQFYYSFSPFNGFIFIFLDSFHSMRLGYNYNENIYNNMSSRVNHIDGIGFNDEQLNWMEKELIKYKNDIIIIFVHCPIENTKDYNIENKKLKQLIKKYKNIKIVFSGHVHYGISTEVPDKDTGVWHRSLEGLCEAPLNTQCFANALFYKDRVELKGYGVITDATYHFRK